MIFIRVSWNFNDHIIFLIEEDGGSDSGTEPQDDDFAETRFSRSARDGIPNQKSEEELCNMYTQAVNWELLNGSPLCKTLPHYLPVDADVFKQHTAGNKYGDSWAFGPGRLQTLDSRLSHKFPQHLKAPALFRSQRVSAISSSSSKHLEQFSFFPKTINHGDGMFSAQSVSLPSPFMCQLPKHISASQVCSSSNCIYLFQACIS